MNIAYIAVALFGSCSLFCVFIVLVTPFKMLKYQSIMVQDPTKTSWWSTKFFAHHKKGRRLKPSYVALAKQANESNCATVPMNESKMESKVENNTTKSEGANIAFGVPMEASIEKEAFNPEDKVVKCGSDDVGSVQSLDEQHGSPISPVISPVMEPAAAQQWGKGESTVPGISAPTGANNNYLETREIPSVMPGVFFGDSPTAFYECIEHVIMFVSLYCGIWLVNYYPLCFHIISDYRWGYQLLTLFPGLASICLFLMLIRSAAILKAVTMLDEDSLENTIEEVSYWCILLFIACMLFSCMND